jgi:hypothetical protein
VTFYGFNAWLADAYVERGWFETASGGLVALMNGVTLVGGIGTALVADRIGSRRAFLLVGAPFTVAGAAPLAAAVPGAWAWAVVVGISSGLLFVIDSSTATGRGQQIVDHPWSPKRLGCLRWRQLRVQLRVQARLHAHHLTAVCFNHDSPALQRFSVPQPLAACSDGLLIPRSQVRSLPGPSETSCR